MKFLIVIAALVAVSSAQYLRDFGAIVEGPKTVVAGPSGTIVSDTGAIVKSPETRFFGERSAIIAPRTIVDAPLYPRTLLTPGLVGARSYIGSPLLGSSLLAERSLYGLGHDLLY